MYETGSKIGLDGLSPAVLDVRTGEVNWGQAEKKDSWLFVEMLHRLTEVTPKAPAIDVNLDNYSIRRSKIAQAAFSHFAKKAHYASCRRIVPEHNCIEKARKTCTST
jgi:hypothetical protein